MCNHYLTTDLLHTMGDDFEYANAHMVFKNMDYLFNYINQNKSNNMEIIYSTPEDYINEIYKKLVKWPTNNYDFFPYADG